MPTLFKCESDNGSGLPARLKPVTDLSPEAISIGRMIDRLEPGRYIIELNKPQDHTDGWPVNIASLVTIREIKLSR
jgi:hypothetical protein